MLSPFEQSAEILTKAKEDVLLALAGHEHEGISITVTSHLTRLINQLNFLSGANPVTHAAIEFPPITNFFGDEIVKAAEVTKEDLTPTLTEKEIFLNKVAALQSTIRERQPETLISDFSNEPLVLRKVAKNAGLEDYKDGIINIDFIERIKEGLTNNELIDAKEKEINEKLAGEGETDLTLMYDGNRKAPDGAENADTSNDPLSTTKTLKVVKTTKPPKEGE